MCLFFLRHYLLNRLQELQQFRKYGFMLRIVEDLVPLSFIKLISSIVSKKNCKLCGKCKNTKKEC